MQHKSHTAAQPQVSHTRAGRNVIAVCNTLVRTQYISAVRQTFKTSRETSRETSRHALAKCIKVLVCVTSVIDSTSYKYYRLPQCYTEASLNCVFTSLLSV
jgi:hypothetical protein